LIGLVVVAVLGAIGWGAYWVVRDTLIWIGALPDTRPQQLYSLYQEAEFGGFGFTVIGKPLLKRDSSGPLLLYVPIRIRNLQNETASVPWMGWQVVEPQATLTFHEDTFNLNEVSTVDILPQSTRDGYLIFAISDSVACRLLILYLTTMFGQRIRGYSLLPACP
jgi:hypothetical protein